MRVHDEATHPEFLARLRAYVRRRVPTDHDADDVVQDVLVKLLRKGESVAPGSARAWVFTVARRELQDRWRRKRPTAVTSSEQAAPEPDDGNESVAYLAKCMEPMLAMLREEDRELIRRIDVLDEPQAAVARALGMPASSFKSRVQRARRRLRDLLEDCCTVERDRRGTPVEHARRLERPCPCGGPADVGTDASSGCGGAAPPRAASLPLPSGTDADHLGRGPTIPA